MIRAVAAINLAAIERNCRRLRRELGPGTGLGVVVKGDGYGHGAVPVARAALAAGADWLAVAAAQEAAELRRAGLEGPLLVMGALSPEELEVALEARADVVAWHPQFVQRLVAQASEPVGVHVKLDTGMGRLGTRDPDEARRVATAVAEAPDLRLTGAMTHFATADEPGSDGGFFERQLERFAAFAESIRGDHPGVLAHAANSAATLRSADAHFDLVRCGVAVYGLDPFQEDAAARELEPALELRSYVGDLKPTAAGESAGYGRRFVAERDTVLGVLPIGYGDGLRRDLRDRADVLVGGRRVPLVGTVSMDNVTVDLGPDPAAGVGDPAVLIGADGGERIFAEELARRLGTINYEITCAITSRVPRAYHRDGEPA
jgi:alanine racemase